MTSVSDSPIDPLVGQLIDDRYRIVARLARGGMASVYVADDLRLDRPVAVKLMHAHLAESPQFIARFKREARAAARISHRGVVPVYDQGNFGDQGYLVMELIDGPNLRTVLSTNGPLSVDTALTYTREILEALSAAHKQGVIHRDLKPENVLVASDGTLRVVDFGLARAVSDVSLSSTGSVLGTVAYVAPESVSAGTIDERTDLFAVGVMLFEMLTGTVPWAGSLPVQSAYSRIHESIPVPSSLVPDLPPALDVLVAALSARQPEDRPSNTNAAIELVDEARLGLSSEQLEFTAERTATPVAATGTELVPINDRTSKLPVRKVTVHTSGKNKGSAPAKRKERAPLFALIAVLLVAVVAAGVWWWMKFGPGAYVDVPYVAEMSQSAAEATLEVSGLRTLTRQEYSDDVPAGIVIESNPEAGARAHKDTVVTLYVSQGIKMVTVPDLKGQTREEAEEEIAQSELKLGPLKESWSETVPAGEVISSTPAAGATVRHSSEVALEVSKGREPIPIPNVVGTSAEEAAEAITGAGLVPVATEAHFDDVPAGVVASQDPTATAGSLFRNDEVSYVVSLGPELFEIPSVKGMNIDEATQVLREAGFAVEVNRIASFFNFVGEQTPAAGESFPKGTVVTLSVV